MARTLDKVTIEGFKSIRKLDDFKLSKLNVLIGANGAGKSNFVSFFRLLRELIEQRLQLAVAVEGGADACLFLGPKETTRLRAKLHFDCNGYEFSLVPSQTDQLIFESEKAVFQGDSGERPIALGSGHIEAKLKDRKDSPGIGGAKRGVPHYVFDAISSWVVYHFHDTSFSAGVRRPQALNDNLALRPSAENLAPFLHRLNQTNHDHYLRIRDAVRLAAPFFDDFLLRPIPGNEEKVQLEWRQRDSDYPFRASQLSDGTLRFICMATALLQPCPPSIMLFDEPELGLHPYALTLLGNLFQKATKQYFGPQIIVSTQSALLLNEFEPNDVIVVERAGSESTFRRLSSEHLSEWLQDYTLGELWQKNLLGGRPGGEYVSLSAPNGDQSRS